jgi:DNA polymerase-3 subunit alpha
MEDDPSFVANGIVVHNSGMKKLLKDLAVVFPLKFEDIAAATALYRPGPIDAGLVDQFVAIKQNKKAAEYDHPLMEPALTETYGVITYQEQVMQICRDLCGFSMKDSDHVRRAMGKKDKEKMASYREVFTAGAVKGSIEVELEDGRKIVVHRAKTFPCADGVDRTVEDALKDGVEILSLT